MSTTGAVTSSRNMDPKHKLRAEYTSKLEVESQQMEDRLKMLKTMLAAEKARRNVEGGIHWKSTKPSQPSAQKSGKGRSPKSIRVKVLTNKEAKRKITTTSSTPCGQCDKNSASLSCIECVENYCQVCFVKIHQKGALANHHVKPKVSAKPEEKAAVTTNTTVPIERKQMSSSGAGTEVNNTSLLDGAYDEASSAASFQEALAEWRAGGRVENKKTIVSTRENTYQAKESATSTKTASSTSTSTSAVSKKQPVDITFSHDTGVSYFEKLITRRSRYDPTFLKKMAPKQTPTALVLLENYDATEPEETVYTPSPYNVFYESEDGNLRSFYEEQSQELYRPMSSIQIEAIAEAPRDVGLVQPLKSHSSETSKPKSRLPSSAKSLDMQTTKTKPNRKNKGRPKSTSKKQPSKPPSQASSQDVQTSVQKAWADCSREKQRPRTAELTQFFLQGVQPTTTDTDDDLKHTEQSPVKADLSLAATVWLPFNSITSSKLNTELENNEYDSDSDSDNEPLSRCTSVLSNKSLDLESAEELAERHEWDKEDNDTLESLAWELASTVESEGRLSRCDSVLDSMGDSYEGDKQYLEEYDVRIGPVDINQVVSEFELYQQQLLDEEI